MRKLKNCSKHSIVEKVSTTDKFWTMKSSNLCLFTILWRKKKSAGNDLVILRMGNKNWLSSYAFVEQAVAAPQVAVKARRYPNVTCHAYLPLYISIEDNALFSRGESRLYCNMWRDSTLGGANHQSIGSHLSNRKKAPFIRRAIYDRYDILWEILPHLCTINTIKFSK